MRRFGEYLLVRLVWVLGLLSLAAWCGGCRCESRTYDQTFLLNAAVDTSLIAPDAGDDASVANADGGSGVWLDCTPAAAGCVAGSPCPAACRCVLDRDHQPSGATSITKCTLLDGPAPAVAVRYTSTFGGCGD
jgi:hypothetical protein